MTQNRSHAVMAQRHEAHDSLNDFPTPPWATRALIEHVLIGGGWRRDNLAGMTCRVPAANRGYMVRPLAECFASVAASDVHDYGCGYPLLDYLSVGIPRPVDWTICNPPYRLGMEFVWRALQTSRVGVAMFVRCAFHEGVTRYEELFSKHRPIFYSPFAERVILTKGRLLDPDREYPDIDPKTGEQRRDPKTGELLFKKPSTATAYAWFVWATGNHHCAGREEVRMIPPCRKALTRPGDYPDSEEAA